MKILLPVLVALMFVSGCTASVTKEQFDALQDRVSNVERQATDAAGAASRAASDASAAKAAADRASSSAKDANEKADRIAGTCCGRK
jgi:hypothetical protein